MCVLLVEDEPFIREIMVESLQDAGFDVMEATTGDHAMELIRNPPRPFTLVVTDLQMPGGSDGTHVAAFTRQQWPSIRVVIASGRPDIFCKDWKNDPGYSLLRKPYTPNELISLIQRLLEKPA